MIKTQKDRLAEGQRRYSSLRNSSAITLDEAKRKVARGEIKEGDYFDYRVGKDIYEGQLLKGEIISFGIKGTSYVESPEEMEYQR